MRLVLIAEYDIAEDEGEIRWTMHEFMRTIRSGPVDPVGCSVAIRETADAVVAALSGGPVVPVQPERKP